MRCNHTPLWARFRTLLTNIELYADEQHCCHGSPDRLERSWFSRNTAQWSLLGEQYFSFHRVFSGLIVRRLFGEQLARDSFRGRVTEILPVKVFEHMGNQKTYKDIRRLKFSTKKLHIHSRELFWIPLEFEFRSFRIWRDTPELCGCRRIWRPCQARPKTSLCLQCSANAICADCHRVRKLAQLIGPTQAWRFKAVQIQKKKKKGFKRAFQKERLKRTSTESTERFSNRTTGIWRSN